ncbi:uncharacterized protein K489DRAFT_379125 [Dissoconium aciculare CBS 342.82]|uniref:Uncharacterized protein n=1 Tax=Dissoconium aciculare CBS 342.82 TaxID=1314786 RepID=A0A6J3MCX5_9PEZI|nr:uncharacterized protein K489DRAFT_379125 [Dissoconium aciculare CBS 342.82]KAF1824692.1 hypothetical protein K489DRAFT_379125 [Dissoconium aciculare CBS 342.82]
MGWRVCKPSDFSSQTDSIRDNSSSDVILAHLDSDGTTSAKEVALNLDALSSESRKAAGKDKEPSLDESPASTWSVIAEVAQRPSDEEQENLINLIHEVLLLPSISPDVPDCAFWPESVIILISGLRYPLGSKVESCELSSSLANALQHPVRSQDRSPGGSIAKSCASNSRCCRITRMSRNHTQLESFPCNSKGINNRLSRYDPPMSLMLTLGFADTRPIAVQRTRRFLPRKPTRCHDTTPNGSALIHTATE